MISRVRANLIWVRDVVAAKSWYETVLGFVTIEEHANDGFLRMKLGTDEFFIEHHNPEIHPAFHGAPGGRRSFILEADDLVTTIHEIEQKGGKIVQPATKQFYGGWNAIIADPDGNEFLLIEETPHAELEAEHSMMLVHGQSSDPEVSLVTACVTDYFEGMYFRDFDRLTKAFHVDAKLYGYRDGTFTILSLADWFNRVSSRPIPAENGEPFDMSIESIDLTVNVGCVKVRDLYMGLLFTDYLGIAKIDGRWKIMSKIFHHEPKS